MTSHDELKRAAEAATPANQWGARGWQADRCDDGPGAAPTWCIGANGVGHFPIAWAYSERDAHYIALANPATVLSLLAENEALRAALEEIAHKSVFSDKDAIVRHARSALSRAIHQGGGDA